jgi:3-dehydroquinate synthase
MLRKQTKEILIADDWFSAELTAAGREGIIIQANEMSKSLDAIPNLIISLRKHGANRQTGLVALGGGIVQDVAAFIASVYMRGLEWTYFPTTLLAMADSCIGGKSSINVGPYKNLVGTFHPPRAVLIDPMLALTLSDERRIGGLVEAVKICYCRGGEAFDEYMALEPRASMSVGKVEQILTCSLQAKKWFIEADEFDKSERLLLNFGHTFGHAIEGASHFNIEHGVGVGVGILCAIEFGRRIGRIYAGIKRVQLLEEHLRSLLNGVVGLRDRIAELSIQDVIDRFRADKKHGTASYALILIAESGTVELHRLPKDECSIGLVQASIESALEAITVPNARSIKANEI